MHGVISNLKHVFASKLACLTFTDGAPADQMFVFQPSDATVSSVLSASLLLFCVEYMYLLSSCLSLLCAQINWTVFKA